MVDRVVVMVTRSCVRGGAERRCKQELLRDSRAERVGHDSGQCHESNQKEGAENEAEEQARTLLHFFIKPLLFLGNIQHQI